MAILPLVALGCSIYAAWSLYWGWKENRDKFIRSKMGRRREHPVVAALQWGLFVVFSLALLITGLLMFGKTAPQSPLAAWLHSPAETVADVDSTSAVRLKDLPGAFEISLCDPSQPVIGAALSNLPTGDADIARLVERCPRLEWVHLHNTNVTGSAMPDLARLRSLQLVTLAQTSIDDQGLKYLRSLSKLEELNLRGTSVSDAGLEYLRCLTSLKELDLRETRVSDKAVCSLRTSLPDCTIHI